MFEAVRSGFDGQVAIDDVAFLVGPCTIPRKCSFEGQKCGYSSYGAINWLHRNGHTTTANGPKTDHTLGTELGQQNLIREQKTGKQKIYPILLSLSRLLHDGQHRRRRSTTR